MAPFEEVPCRLCGGEIFRTLAERDCVGLPVRTVMCSVCGLAFISPRPTADWYRQFYSSLGGRHHEYKQSGYTGDAQQIGAGFEQARKHGAALARRFAAYLRPGLTIDVGSSEGGVLAGIRDVLAVEPIGIEPVPAEAAYATRRGIPTHALLIEEISSRGIALPTAANIICVKSLNHLLDPAHFFRWAWAALAPDGRLLLEVKNFRHQVRRTGRITSGIQLDHPYLYLPETLLRFVERAGFRILHLDVDEGKPTSILRAQSSIGLPTGHIRLAAAKIDQLPFAVPFAPHPAEARAIARDLSPLRLYLYYLARYATIRSNIGRRIARALSV